MLQKRYAERSLREIGDLFGAAFAEALAALDPEDTAWVGPVRSAYGWHPIKLLAVEDAYVPEYEEVSDRVRIDAQQAARREANADYYDNLKAKYSIAYPADQS